MRTIVQAKEDFPIFRTQKNLIYLDSASTSQKPQMVIDAVTDFYQNYNANIHRGLYSLAEKATAKVDEVRRLVTRFINARRPEEIIFVKGTTEGLNLIAYTWGVQHITKGDIVVTTTMEHHANFVPWQQLAKRAGARFDVVGVTGEGLLDMSDLMQKAKYAKLFTLPYVSNVLGTINPVKEIIHELKKINPSIVTVVDAAQAVPHFSVDVQDLDCDFLVFSGHKMLAETGIGVLYGKKELLLAMPPFLFGGDMVREVTKETTSYADLPNKFEGGTLNLSGVISLGTAIKYLEKVGIEQVRSHELSLITYTLEKLSGIKDLTILGSRDVKKRSGVISFTIDRIHPHDIAQVLAEHNICVRSGHHCAMPLHAYYNISASARVSFYLYNTKEDIDSFADVLRKIARLFSS